MVNMRREYEEAYRDYEDTHFYFLARKQLVLWLIQSFFPRNKAIQVLDLGCGTGNVLAFLARRLKGSFTGLDSSKFMLSKHKGPKSIRLVHGDLYAPAFKPHSFDVVLSLDVLEHLKDDTGCLKSIDRMLKPGGVAILVVPAFMCLWSVHDDLNNHFRRYSWKELNEKTDLIRGNKRLFFWNAASFIPKLIARFLFSKRELKKGSSDIEEPVYTAFPINQLVQLWLGFENIWLTHGLPLPFGSSLVVVIKKP